MPNLVKYDKDFNFNKPWVFVMFYESNAKVKVSKLVKDPISLTNLSWLA